jgi:hypothetical protein
MILIPNFHSNYIPCEPVTNRVDFSTSVAAVWHAGDHISTYAKQSKKSTVLTKKVQDFCG